MCIDQARDDRRFFARGYDLRRRARVVVRLQMLDATAVNMYRRRFNAMMGIIRKDNAPATNNQLGSRHAAKLTQVWTSGRRTIHEVTRNRTKTLCVIFGFWFV